MNEDEFNLYIEQLVEQNIIVKKTQDKCDFYYVTPNSRTFLVDKKYRNKVLQTVKTILPSVVATVLNKI